MFFVYGFADFFFECLNFAGQYRLFLAEPLDVLLDHPHPRFRIDFLGVGFIDTGTKLFAQFRQMLILVFGLFQRRFQRSDAIEYLGLFLFKLPDAAFARNTF